MTFAVEKEKLASECVAIYILVTGDAFIVNIYKISLGVSQAPRLIIKLKKEIVMFEYTNKQSQLDRFSGSQGSSVTQKEKTVDNESQSIHPYDKSKSEFDVNSDSDTKSSIKQQKPLIWRLRQLCRFWQPILGVIAATVSLLLSLPTISHLTVAFFAKVIALITSIF